LPTPFDLPFPTHIKIDVDGLEERGVNGAQRTINDPRLKSVLIEIHDEENETQTMLVDAGLRLADSGKNNKIYVRS
jgi:hypothetical protein